MAFIDYYKILGVKKDIPQDEVKAAFRKRTKQFHPDLHPNDPKAKAKFQALTEAYDVIGDPVKRKKYDQYGERWKDMDAFNNHANGGAYNQQYDAGADFGGLATPANKEQKETMIQVQPSVLICILHFLAEKLLLKFQTEVK